MKKIVLFSSLLVLSATFGSVAASAVEPTSTASFEFTTEKEGEETVNPPVDPTKPILPETGNKGQLVIDAVSNLDFGQTTIGGGQTVVTASVPEKETLGIQVTDKRGEGQGWNVKAKISKFQDQTEPEKQLRAAEVKIPKGTFKTVANGDIANPPVVANEAGTVIGEENTLIFSAAKDKGMGSWVHDWSDQVQLTIPAGNHVGAYSATITWEISNTPEK